MDYQLGLGTLAFIVTCYGTYLQRKQLKMMTSQDNKAVQLPVWWKAPEVLAMAVLCVLAWVPYFMQPREALANDGTDPAAVTMWGAVPNNPGLFHLRANSKHFAAYASKYKMVELVLQWDGLHDPVDASPIYKSNLYDIRDENVDMYVQPPPGAPVSHFGLLLVPSGTDMSSFATIRQAQALGGKWVWKGTSVLSTQISR